ncbi:MAG: hypothetical protein WBK91_04490, partial [Alphaproteobacteria bacterium]
AYPGCSAGGFLVSTSAAPPIGLPIYESQMIHSIQQVSERTLSGKFYAADKHDELRLGSFLGLAGWLPWCYVPHTWILLASIPLWSCGNILYRTGIEGRWYHNRSATAILGKEILLTVARILCVLFIIPVMFSYPEAFAILAVITSVVMLLASRKRL